MIVAPPPPQTFQISKFEISNSEQAKEQLKSSQENGKVDIFYRFRNEAYQLSGDKISLEEFGQALPHMHHEVQLFDRNEDGFLEESELKYNAQEALNKAVGNYLEKKESLSFTEFVGLSFDMAMLTSGSSVGLSPAAQSIAADAATIEGSYRLKPKLRENIFAAM